MYIYSMIEAVKKATEEYIVKAILPQNSSGDYLVKISPQYNVEDGIFYMYISDKEDLYVDELKANLCREASDKCWRTNGDLFDEGKSDFNDCEVSVVNTDVDQFASGSVSSDGDVFDVLQIQVDEENKIIYLNCKDAPEVEETVNITLTKEEIKLVKEAIDFYGDYAADKGGYSIGEQFWDIKEKIQTQEEM